MNEPDEILTTKEAAEFLKVSEVTLIRRAKAGEVPAYKDGDGPRAPWRFLRSELRAGLRRYKGPKR